MSQSIYCPYCHKFTSLDSLTIRTGTSIGGRNVTTSASWYDSDRKNTWTMKKCNSCHGVVMLKNQGETMFPSPLPKPIDERIAEVVKIDLKEAKLCYSVSAFKATVVLSRRALQSICIDKGASKKKKLYEQIQDLANRGIITNDLKEWATEVRYVGNEGAHPGEEITKEDAEAILKLTEQIANVIYIMPEIAKELRQKRNEKSK